jgi:hypothetical protein
MRKIISNGQSTEGNRVRAKGKKEETNDKTKSTA